MTQLTKHKGPGRDTTSATAIATAERHANWLQARKRGKSYRAIAAEAGVTPNAVFEAVKSALSAIRDEPAEELRKLELEALDDLIDDTLGEFTVATELAERLACIEQVRKLRSDRRKVLGVDAPTKVEQTHEIHTIELTELRALLNGMGYDIVPLPQKED